ALADQTVQFLDRQTDEAAPAIALVRLRCAGAGRVVATRAEGAVAGAGQHDDPDIVIVLGVAHRLEHLLDGFGAERVQHFRAVDRDRRDAVALVIEDVLIGHGPYLRGSMLTPDDAAGRLGRARLHVGRGDALSRNEVL